MDTQLDRESGRMLKSTMEDLGVNIHLERWTVNVLGDQRVSGLAFREGDLLDCDMVAAGVRPNVVPSSRITCPAATIQTSTPSGNAPSTGGSSTVWWLACGTRREYLPSA